MNLGFYIDSLKENEDSKQLFEMLNTAVETTQIESGSIFYDNVDYHSTIPKFGIFNSTDLWFFTGKLVTTSWETYKTASNIINKFTSCFLYSGVSDVTVFALNEIINSCKVIVTKEEDRQYVKRITGKDAVLVDGLTIDKLKEVL